MGSYVELSIDSQQLWLYKDGALITETRVVTGLPTPDRQTPGARSPSPTKSLLLCSAAMCTATRHRCSIDALCSGTGAPRCQLAVLLRRKRLLEQRKPWLCESAHRSGGAYLFLCGGRISDHHLLRLPCRFMDAKISYHPAVPQRQGDFCR